MRGLELSVARPWLSAARTQMKRRTFGGCHTHGRGGRSSRLGSIKLYPMCKDPQINRLSHARARRTELEAQLNTELEVELSVARPWLSAAQQDADEEKDLLGLSHARARRTELEAQ